MDKLEELFEKYEKEIVPSLAALLDQMRQALFDMCNEHDIQHMMQDSSLSCIDDCVKLHGQIKREISSQMRNEMNNSERERQTQRSKYSPDNPYSSK